MVERWIRRTAFGALIAGGMAFASPAVAQQKDAGAAAPPKAAAKPAAAKKPTAPEKANNLEAIAAEALAGHPDVLVAEAKVAEAKALLQVAEANLQKARFEALRQTVVQHTNIATQEESVRIAATSANIAKSQLENTVKMRKNNVVSQAEVDVAQQKYDAAQSALIQERAKLSQLKTDTSLFLHRENAAGNVVRTYPFNAVGSIDLALGLIQNELASRPFSKVAVDGGKIVVSADNATQIKVGQILKTVQSSQQGGGGMAEPRPDEPGENAVDLAKKLLATELKFTASFDNTTLEEVATWLASELSKTMKNDVHIRFDPRSDLGRAPVSLKSTKPIRLAALLRLLEDATQSEFVVREYGFLVRSPSPDLRDGVDRLIQEMGIW